MSLPWFPFNAKAFISDTMRLSTEGKGAYLLLLLDYYEQGKPAPDDDYVLASITGLSMETWRLHRRVIEPLFQIEGGLWRHARCEKEMAEAADKVAARSKSGKAGAEARWQKDGKRNGDGNGKRMRSPVATASRPHGNRMPEAMPEFGPSVTAPSHNGVEGGTEVPPDSKPMANALANAMPPEWQPHAERNGERMHIDINNERREGANAPSPVVGISGELGNEVFIGSLMQPDWMPSSEAVATAKAEGVPMAELSVWLDEWKQRCIDDGSRSTLWSAAWDREYHRRMLERAKAKPKPRVAVSRKTKLDKIPDGWQPNESHTKIAGERNLDIAACVESFADYIVNKRPDWKDADAAFRNWLKSPHRTEFKRHGQVTQRRAPAPGGGSSILDAGARFEQRLDELAARRGHRTDAEDQPHVDAPVLSLPEE